MSPRTRYAALGIAGLLLLTPQAHAQQNTAERQSMEELRNTVVNLLQALVEKGLLTREQAERLVKEAQDKAAADAAAAAAKRAQVAKEEESAVRVPYVPQIVKDEIAKEVAAQVEPNLKKEVVDEVSTKGSLYAALPDWVQHMKWSGDVRTRTEGDLFANDNVSNVTGVYLNYNQINSKGGFDKAGPLALLNTTENQTRLRLRARFGFDTDLGSGWSASAFLATGSVGEIIATTNQTLGTYGAGYTVTIDQGYLRWSGDAWDGDEIFTGYAGRFPSPWLGTDLVWYNDLTFEGVVLNDRVNFSSDAEHRKELFLTAAGMPLTSFSPLDSAPTAKQKWLLGGQLGLDLNFEDDSRLRLAAAYYDYLHIVGMLNPVDSTIYNWTAPTFVQKGNTMYDISNSTDPTVNLYALAADFRIVDVIVVGDWHLLPAHSLGLTLEALKNIGFNTAEVEQRVGSYVAPRNKGYRGDVSFGTSSPPAFGAWRASVGYRYLQRDAVLDAFNDEDFHLGGTDATGYTVQFDFSFTPRVYMRAKYMSANEIDGPYNSIPGVQRLGIDVWQLDLNARF